MKSWSRFQPEHPLLLAGPYLPPHFPVSAQTLEAEQRTFKLLFKMNVEHVVSFPPAQGALFVTD